MLKGLTSSLVKPTPSISTSCSYFLARNMSYAAIVIGSGQAGGPLAMAFANAGKKTALIEEVHVGGTCINEGCVRVPQEHVASMIPFFGRKTRVARPT